MARMGRPPVGPRVTTNVAPELDDLIRTRAAESDTTIAAAVRDLLERGAATILEDQGPVPDPLRVLIAAKLAASPDNIRIETHKT